jgi:nucleoside-diphosphate-sugar epimerase
MTLIKSKKKILVIGGTRFLGIEFIKLINQDHYEMFVASRKEIKTANFRLIDRKSQADINKLFSESQYDVVIDFICYSSMDADILYNALLLQNRMPKLILISTVYTYCHPLENKMNNTFNEEMFDAAIEIKSLRDRSEVSYSLGKREMEGFFSKRISKEKLVILRFPIILGANDYTQRTHFYINLIKNRQRINPTKINIKTNYIFAHEAANAILNFTVSNEYGTYNVAFESISERDLIENFCNYFEVPIDQLVDNTLLEVETPFTNCFDFIIDSTRYSSKFPFKTSFQSALIRELSKIAI